jgi:hypothetical protein
MLSLGTNIPDGSSQFETRACYPRYHTKLHPHSSFRDCQWKASFSIHVSMTTLVAEKEKRESYWHPDLLETSNTLRASSTALASLTDKPWRFGRLLIEAL